MCSVYNQHNLWVLNAYTKFTDSEMHALLKMLLDTPGSDGGCRNLNMTVISKSQSKLRDWGI